MMSPAIAQQGFAEEVSIRPWKEFEPSDENLYTDPRWQNRNPHGEEPLYYLRRDRGVELTKNFKGHPELMKIVGDYDFITVGRISIVYDPTGKILKKYEVKPEHRVAFHDPRICGSTVCGTGWDDGVAVLEKNISDYLK